MKACIVLFNGVHIFYSPYKGIHIMRYAYGTFMTVHASIHTMSHILKDDDKYRVYEVRHKMIPILRNYDNCRLLPHESYIILGTYTRETK